MARFQPAESFHSAADTLQLLPLRFERIGDTYLVANMVGDFIRLSRDELNRLVDLRVRPGDGLYEKVYAAHLITRASQTTQGQLLALRLRSPMGFLRHPTVLHIFVVTLRCEHSCPYCQVSRKSTDRAAFDMSGETAEQALKIAFQSLSQRIKIEFQGGEPLLPYRGGAAAGGPSGAAKAALLPCAVEFPTLSFQQFEMSREQNYIIIILLFR